MAIAFGCQGISKNYGPVQALSDVSLQFEAGKIHVLLGQNGAGKSTFSRILAGLETPDQGTVSIGGDTSARRTVFAARAAGLDMVHQRFSLPPTFKVYEALEFSVGGKQRPAIFSARSAGRKWQRALDDFGIKARADARLASLPVETAQSLEILRALSNSAKSVILDEPTALLSPPAISDLFTRLRTLKAGGVTLMVILHKLAEVMEIADTVSVLREGQIVLPPTPVEQTSAEQLRQLMIGDAVRPEPIERDLKVTGDVALALEHASSPDADFEPGLRDVTLSAKAGEVLGIAGVEGNGQRALADLLFGFRRLNDGRLTLHGTSIAHLSRRQRRELGMRAIPFDRMTQGASLDSPIWENVSAWKAGAFVQGPLPLVSLRSVKAHVRVLLERFGVRYAGVEQAAGALSGGNLQRVILARETDGKPSFVLAAQPTRGLDFAATEFVLQTLLRLRNNGTAVIVISSDLDELFRVSDRIAVFRGGRISGVFTAPFARDMIGHAMVGGGS